MSKKLKIGLVGPGDIGRLHARALRKREDVELCVCMGLDRARSEDFAREFGAELYPSYPQLLADPSIAAVDICVPNDLHRTFVEKAAAAGKHILCEKPIALSVEDGAAMVEASRQGGVVLMVGHVMRFWPEYARMRAMIRSCELGLCKAVTLRRMLSLLISVKGEDGWRQRPERMGGAVLDLQIHDLDFLVWTFGLPERVYCAGASSRDGALNHVYSTLTWSSGTTALVEASYMLQGDPMIFTAKVVCEEGTLDYGLDLRHFDMHVMAGPEGGMTARNDPATLVCYRAGAAETLARQEPDILSQVFAAELSHFVDCVQSGTQSVTVSTSEAVDALRVAVACRTSALSGVPVLLGATAPSI